MTSRILTLLCCILFQSIIAQNKITGTVYDENEYIIQDVYIYVQGNETLHSHTDENGVFVIENLSVNDTLIFSHTAFETFRHTVKNTNTLKIVLKEKQVTLETVEIRPVLKTLNAVAAVDLKKAPVKNAQEILQKVPGLIIGQHAGGGKAEQIFLRGFDIDHGTDIALNVDGMPVNMVSHAHGQGYSDLHFLIPETISKIDFGKGSYYTDIGNFGTAGYVNFNTKDRFNNSLIKLEGGQFDTFRLLGVFDILKKQNESFYLASEYIATDGYFDAPQNFSRFNLFTKYTKWLNNRKDLFTISGSYFTSQWDASGQIPNRAVPAIGRFGAIDATEGGFTNRSNLNMNYTKRINENTFIKNNLYLSYYDFELYSNFTFFLNDPVNGDQIRQKEDRLLFGSSSELNYTFGENRNRLQIAAGFRKDMVNDNELSRTRNRRETLSRIQFGDINEMNLFSYVNTEFKFGKWLINPGLRLDYIKFGYTDFLQQNYQRQTTTQSTLSPKLNILYNPQNNLQFYVKSGLGFHSNDSRVVLQQTTKEILPSAFGTDIGAIYKPNSKLVLNAALWSLFSEQEFVYVGDEGIVEPSGKTKRYGADLGIRYQARDWLYLNTDVTYAYARTVSEDEFIPLAVPFTWTFGANTEFKSGWYAGLQSKFIADRPANEDNSITAEGYFVTDINLGYQINKFDIMLSVANVFNVDWNETQFATTSQLANETTPVTEIHFTPGTPFFAKVGVTYKF